MDAALMQAFARELLPHINREQLYGEGYKHDVTPASPITAGYSHGPGGLPLRQGQGA